MKKIIIGLLFYVLFLNFSFAGGLTDISTGWVSTCTESRCANDRIDELIKVNERLLDENLSFRIQQQAFSGWLENYIKTLDESRKISEEKRVIYTDILNELKILIYIFWWLLLLIVTWIWLYKNGQLTEAKEELKEYKWELKDSFSDYKTEVKDIRENIKNELSKDENLKKEIKDSLSDELSNILNSWKTFNDLLDDKTKILIIDKIYEMHWKSIIDNVVSNINGSMDIKFSEILQKKEVRLNKIEVFLKALWF